MPRPPDPFRDFGLLPPDAAVPPAGPIRAHFSWARIAGQYLATGIMSFFGIAMGLLFAVAFPFPWGILAAALPLSGFGYLVRRATRDDYAWVELDGQTLRAKHLYTARVVERSIAEIDDLLTMVFQVRKIETILTEAWLGRVRGFVIRFADGRTPLQVCRTDPKMTNAKALMDGIVLRMSERGEIDAEVIEFDGSPLVRRIFWTDTSPEIG